MGFLTGTDSGFQSTLSKGQENVLGMFTDQTQQYMPQTTKTLAGLANAPRSSYSELGNWEDQFRSGMVDPLTRRMKQDVSGLSHSNKRHSSFRRKQEQDVRQNYSDKIAGMRYQQMMQERQMQQGALENAFRRQQSALGQMQGIYNTGLSKNARQYVQGEQGLLGSMASKAAGGAMSYLGGGMM